MYVCRSDVYASQRWYYWKAKPEQVNAITKMFPWLCYSVHMLSVWLVLYLQHKAKVSMCVGTRTRSLYGKRRLENTSVMMLFSSLLYLTYISMNGHISLMIKNPADKLKSLKFIFFLRAFQMQQVESTQLNIRVYRINTI